MPEDEYRKVFVRKLAYYMQLNDKNQIDLMNDLGLKSATVSSWCTGKKLPRMDKIQLLADYFGVEKSDLLEEKDIKTDINTYTEEEKAIIKGWRKSSEDAKRIAAIALGVESMIHRKENDL